MSTRVVCPNSTASFCARSAFQMITEWSSLAEAIFITIWRKRDTAYWSAMLLEIGDTLTLGYIPKQDCAVAKRKGYEGTRLKQITDAK